MKICQPHWGKLREAIKTRGLDHLGAQTGEEAVRAAVTELEGRGAENDFDPLMTCNNMIFAKALEMLGLEIMMQKADGSEPCPICEAVRAFESGWTEGPAGAVLLMAKEKGLVP